MHDPSSETLVVSSVHPPGALPALVISAPSDEIAAHADAKSLAAVTGSDLLRVIDGALREVRTDHLPAGRRHRGLQVKRARLDSNQ